MSRADAGDPDTVVSRARARRPQPQAGARLAASYAVATAAAIVGGGAGVTGAGSLYSSGRICAGSEDLGCAVLAGFGITAAACLAILALGTLLARLGWLWLLVVSGLASLVVQITNFDMTSPWWLTLLVIPLAASVATDPAPHWRRRWRLVGSAGVGGALLVWFALNILLALA